MKLTKEQEKDVNRAMRWPGWRWLEGMLAVAGNQRRRIWFKEMEADSAEGLVCHPETGRTGRWMAGNESMWPHTDIDNGWIPDITDAATGGCLMSLVMEGDWSVKILPAGSGDWTFGEMAVYVANFYECWSRGTCSQVFVGADRSYDCEVEGKAGKSSRCYPVMPDAVRAVRSRRKMYGIPCERMAEQAEPLCFTSAEVRTCPDCEHTASAALTKSEFPVRLIECVTVLVEVNLVVWTCQDQDCGCNWTCGDAEEVRDEAVRTLKEALKEALKDPV
jgi:hypothetical protein